MIRITRIVDRSVLDKVDTDKLRELLPEVDREVALIICVTKQERKEDVWDRDGIRYCRIVFDFENVNSMSKEAVSSRMNSEVLKKLELLLKEN